MSFKVGPWIQTDPSELVAHFLQKSPARDSVVSPSPYDVPLGLRVVEGDPEDPAYDLEVMYLGGSEQTTSKLAANLGLEVGAKSGRIYRFVVDRQLASEGARARVEHLARAIEALRPTVAQGRAATNYDLLAFAMRENEGQITSQLAGFKGGRAARAKSKRIDLPDKKPRLV